MHETENDNLPRPGSPLSAPAGSGTRLRVGGLPLDADILAALLPDFAIERGREPREDVPFVTIAQGLLRAPPWGPRRAPWLSMTARTIAGPESPADRLNPARVLISRGWELPALLARAAAARHALVASKVGGNWWHGDGKAELPDGADLALVAIDNPASLDKTALAEMWGAALAENAAARVVVVVPARSRRRINGFVAPGVTVVDKPLDPWAALARADRVYSLGGEIGFLALLAGRSVRCFGEAFYSGWGVTTDGTTVPGRPFPRTVDEIFAGACLVATRYLDPFHRRASSFEDVLAVLADWRKLDEANRPIAVCVGMSFWKRRRIAEFLRSSAGTPVFRRGVRGALAVARTRQAGAIAAWRSRIPAGLVEATAGQGVPLIRVEDGFVRSVGLGSDFLPPASLVLDARGIYFDPSVKSDLDVLLGEAEFDARLIERAGRLIDQLVHRGVTKYNLGGGLGDGIAPAAWPAGRRRILVPGQVEDDLSVLLGGGDIRTNLALLARVRADNPDAYILYKPHPDVLAGHRKGAVAESRVRQFADAVTQGGSTAALLGEIDELHTITSLAGFEALLRRRRVVVYGRPFYAGWGLTEDLLPIDRGRNLTLAQLVAGALILYPRYLDPVTRLPCGPEIVIERLDHPELWRAGPLVWARRLQGSVARWCADRLARRPPPAEISRRGDG